MRFDNLGLIACVDKNWAIGYQNDLLFHIREDMRRFTSMTTGNIVVMGRKTLESLPNSRPLCNRTNIVLTSKAIDLDGILVAHSIAEILNLVSTYHSMAYVIGGGQLYRAMLPYCSFAEITKVEDASPVADCWLPSLHDNPEWCISNESKDFWSSEYHTSYRFIRYDRVKAFHSQ